MSSSESLLEHTDREAWLEERRSGVGGSDAGAILGLNPFKGPHDVWAEKMGEDKDISHKPAIRRGNLLEPVCRDLFALRRGTEIIEVDAQVHPEREWMRGNPDGIILAHEDEWHQVFEAKSPGERTIRSVKVNGPKEHHVAQVQHYLEVLGLDVAHIVYLDSKGMDLLMLERIADHMSHVEFLETLKDAVEIVSFEVPRSDGFIEAMVEAEERFWTDYVLTETPPPQDFGVDPDLPEMDDSVSVMGSEEWAEWADKLFDAREAKKEAKAAEKEAKGALKEMMESESVDAVEVPGQGRIYHRYQRGRSRFDQDALEKAKPVSRVEMYDHLRVLGVERERANEILDACTLDLSQFERQGKPYRTFRPYPAKSRGADS